MYYFSYRSLAGRLTLSFGLVMLLFGAVVATTVVTGGIVAQRSSFISNASMPRTNWIADLQAALVDAQVATQSLILFTE